ncbi:MAG: hypothetical protein LC620_01990, partial [Halobacteriales archaeon]|nr:hypothetical protein [Halobacteriales archaeon]
MTASLFLRQAARPFVQRRQAVAFVFLVLLASVQAAPGPNARPPVALSAPVLALGMADDGTFGATSEDPGSSLPTPGNANAAVDTWKLWNAQGIQVQSGSGDLLNCASRLQDICKTPIPAAAMAPTGARFAFVSNVTPSVMDSTKAQLAVATATGVAARQPLTMAPGTSGMVPGAVAVNHTAGTIAVLERVTHVGAASTSQVEWFDLGSSNAFTAVRPVQPFAGPPTAIAMSDDGTRLAVASDRLYLFAHGTAAPATIGT